MKTLIGIKNATMLSFMFIASICGYRLTTKYYTPRILHYRQTRLGVATDSIATDAISTEVDSMKFFIENHGCQMNLADSDIVRSILMKDNHQHCEVLEDADLILINTCAIREGAESKIWQRLKYFQSIRKQRQKQNNQNKQQKSLNIQHNDVTTTATTTASITASDELITTTLKKKGKGYPIIGVLGCMAERLKNDILDNSDADFIAGPDAYRNLPNLIKLVKFKKGELATSSSYFEAEILVNQELESEETYADISPVRLEEGNVHAFVSIQRGCSNHCAFCVVPYTRGKERSRPIDSILKEITELSDKGIKEVFLLGQNVNSYHDLSTVINTTTISTTDTNTDTISTETTIATDTTTSATSGSSTTTSISSSSSYQIADGFTQKSKPYYKKFSSTSSSSVYNQEGVRFSDLLVEVAKINPEMRIRFQSPHPKDFPDSVLRVIETIPNVCKSLHMPAQHGSTTVLDRMMRGYSREAYIALVQRAREILAKDTPEGVGLGISSDFISGFCGETEDEHQDMISLIKSIGYDQAFTYSYSKREQTYAGLFLQDDIPEDVKARRLSEVITTFYQGVYERNRRLEVGRFHLVLIEGYGKTKNNNNSENKNSENTENDLSSNNSSIQLFTGRTDTNKRVLFPDIPIVLHGMHNQITRDDLLNMLPSIYKNTVDNSTNNSNDITSSNNSHSNSSNNMAFTYDSTNANKNMEDNNSKEEKTYTYGHGEKGDYIIVYITPGGRGHTLKGIPLAKVTLQYAHTLKLPTLRSIPV